jgi:predicted dehydrogenase
MNAPDNLASLPAIPIAVIGCGAIARSFHLPALARDPAIRDQLILVDPDLPRARALADDFEVTEVASSHEEVLDRIAGAIILTPHHLHQPVALACISYGVPVLVEKPIADSAAAVRAVGLAAEQAGVPVAVNNTRRLIPSCGAIRDMIEAGAIGAVRSLDFHEGDPFDWPSASGSMFGRQGSGKGVLLDLGAHVLDLACWWTGGRPSVIRYLDDSSGGSEAVAQVDMEHAGCAVSVRLSWLSKLRNTYLVRGEEGTIEAGIYDWNTLTITTPDGARRSIKTGSEVRSYAALAEPLMANFLRTIAGEEAPLVSTGDVLPSIELIEECYGRRTRFTMPWNDTIDRILPQHD